ncbi:hypothetical protein HaLaN_20816 [Haematococcus lacustris]|uniref:Uncharacterized protein n=1 Tax=Haematococcus lacustris TaxID=44745 RepID=A0A699ZM43_HAELA|nr:hypothetical protein HaLaN_20816 [Haematococcus lacustris]
MSLVAQCLRGSGPVPRSKSRFRLKARENEVIKVPGGAVLRGCKKTKRKLRAHFQLRAGIHSQLRVIASLYGALPAKGKEYPGLGYKRLRDKPPKAQQQQPAEAQ